MRLIISVLVGLILFSCSSVGHYSHLENELERFVADKDATIGIAVIVDGCDTISVNGNRPFPMLSVYKLPIVLAFGDYLRFGNKLQSDRLIITKDDLNPNIYSPMREKYVDEDSIELSLHDIKAYALQQSDNNASDIIVGLMGGIDRAGIYLHRLGADEINVVSTESEMYADNNLCYKNTATPIAMARLIDVFDREFDDKFSREIKQLLESCATGVDRLAKPLKDKGVIIGHKTGTGFRLPDGRIMAVNDAGYVHLPNGRHYTIVVFVENSGYDMEDTEALIAIISEMVYNGIK